MTGFQGYSSCFFVVVVLFFLQLACAHDFSVGEQTHYENAARHCRLGEKRPHPLRTPAAITAAASMVSSEKALRRDQGSFHLCVYLFILKKGTEKNVRKETELDERKIKAGSAEAAVGRV